MTYISQKSNDVMIVITAVFGVLLIVVILLYVRSCIDVQNMVTYIGLLISLCGVALTYYQVAHLKRISEETKKAVNKTKEYIDSLLTISDISKHVSYLRLIKEYVSNDQYHLARLRLSDTLDFIPKITSVNGLMYNEHEYRLVHTSLKANLKSLDYKLNDNIDINKNVFCDEVENAVSFLIIIENQLIKKEYE